MHQARTVLFSNIFPLQYLVADNNLVERSLRSLVVQRKISGGSRSSDESQTTMRLASLFQTRLLGYQPLWAISPEL